MSKAIEKRIMELDEIIKDRKNTLYECEEHLKFSVANTTPGYILSTVDYLANGLRNLDAEIRRNQGLKEELEYAQAQEKKEWIEECIMAYDKTIKEKRKALDREVDKLRYMIEKSTSDYMEHFAGNDAIELTSMDAYVPEKHTDEEMKPLTIDEVLESLNEPWVPTEEEIMYSLHYSLMHIEYLASLQGKEIENMFADLREHEERKHTLEWALEQRRAEDENG